MPGTSGGLPSSSPGSRSSSDNLNHSSEGRELPPTLFSSMPSPDSSVSLLRDSCESSSLWEESRSSSSSSSRNRRRKRTRRRRSREEDPLSSSSDEEGLLDMMAQLRAQYGEERRVAKEDAPALAAMQVGHKLAPFMQRWLLGLSPGEFRNSVLRAALMSVVGGVTNGVAMAGVFRLGITHLTGIMTSSASATLVGPQSPGEGPGFFVGLALSYMLGALLAGLLINKHRDQWRHRQAIVTTIQAIASWLGYVFLLLDSGHLLWVWSTCLVATSCGMQNATTGTYNITGVATDLGHALGQCIKSDVRHHGRKLKQWGSCLLCFIGGGFLGGAAFVHMGVHALAFASGLVTVAALVSWLVVFLRSTKWEHLRQLQKQSQLCHHRHSQFHLVRRSRRTTPSTEQRAGARDAEPGSSKLVGSSVEVRSLTGSEGDTLLWQQPGQVHRRPQATHDPRGSLVVAVALEGAVDSSDHDPHQSVHSHRNDEEMDTCRLSPEGEQDPCTSHQAGDRSPSPSTPVEFFEVQLPPPPPPPLPCGFLFPGERGFVLFACTLGVIGGFLSGFASPGLFGVAMSTVTGSATRLAVGAVTGRLISGHPWYFHLMTVLDFVAGSSLAGLIVEAHPHHWRVRQAVVVTVEASLLWGSLAVHGSFDTLSAQLVALAAGLQNGSTANLPSLPLRTTNLTGIVVEVGYSLGVLIRGRFRCNKPSARLWIFCPLVCCFWLGALLGSSSWATLGGAASIAVAAGAVTCVALGSWVFTWWKERWCVPPAGESASRRGGYRGLTEV